MCQLPKVFCVNSKLFVQRVLNLIRMVCFSLQVRSIGGQRCGCSNGAGSG